MGLLWQWKHDRAPRLEGWEPYYEQLAESDAESVDYRAEGPDAVAAAAHWEAGPSPFVHDRPPTAEFQARLAEKTRETGLDATFVRLPERIAHRRRVDDALEWGAGAGVVFTSGIDSIAVAGLPRDRPLRVTGERMGGEEYADLLRSVVVEVADGPPARVEQIGEVAVDEARLIVADVDALGEWRHVEALDGRADFVFWGRDAPAVAERHAAPELEEGFFGWLDLPVDEAIELGGPIEDEGGELGLATDFRPHSHKRAILGEMRASPTESGTIEVGGATVCAFFTGWGDGFYPVSRALAGDGRLLSIEIELGTDRAVETRRRIVG
jgi:hypothetical protein